MISISYEANERETHITTCDESKTWRIYTLQSKIVNRLKRAGIEPSRVTADGEYFFENIPFNQVSFRAASTRTMSDQQKKAASERLKAARGARK